MVIRKEIGVFDYNDLNHISRATLLRNLKQLFRFTELRLNEFSRSFHNVLSMQEAPNLKTLEICCTSDGPEHHIPDALFLGKVPPALVELTLVFVSIRRTSPLLCTPIHSLRTLSLARCGQVWETRDQMLETLRLFPNLQSLKILHSIPPRGSPRPTEVSLPQLDHLFLGGPPSSVCSVLNSLRIPKDVDLCLELQCEGSGLRESSLAPLVYPFTGLYDATLYEDIQSFHVETLRGAPGDPPNTQFTTFTLGACIPGGRALNVGVLHNTGLRPDDWCLLIDFASLVLPIRSATDLTVSHGSFLPDFPWDYLLQNVPELTSLALSDVAPQSIASTLSMGEMSYYQLEGSFFQLAELRITDSDLSGGEWEDGSPVAERAIAYIHMAFWGADLLEKPSAQRALVVQRCVLNPAVVKVSEIQGRRIIWLENDVEGGYSDPRGEYHCGGDARRIMGAQLFSA